jgi:hypothetical protein
VRIGHRWSGSGWPVTVFHPGVITSVDASASISDGAGDPLALDVSDVMLWKPRVVTISGIRLSDQWFAVFYGGKIGKKAGVHCTGGRRGKSVTP